AQLAGGVWWLLAYHAAKAVGRGAGEPADVDLGAGTLSAGQSVSAARGWGRAGGADFVFATRRV
ncbi:MAG: hypothetical protein ABIR04_11835, partial [Cypionkella sp.]